MAAAVGCTGSRLDPLRCSKPSKGTDLAMGGIGRALESRGDSHDSLLSNMITRFLTDVRVVFNPFSLRSKSARLFLSLIPPSARTEGMKIESKMLPRTSKEPASLGVKFSMYNVSLKILCVMGIQFNNVVSDLRTIQHSNS